MFDILRFSKSCISALSYVSWDRCFVGEALFFRDIVLCLGLEIIGLGEAGGLGCGGNLSERSLGVCSSTVREGSKFYN